MRATFVRIARALRALFTDHGPPKPPPDPRALANPWLGGILDQLGDRYRLGDDTPVGIQILRRTGKARFNPMRVWVRPDGQRVTCEYEAHVSEGQPAEAGKELLDRAVGGRLQELGLAPLDERVEAWHGHLVTRRYQGPCNGVPAATAAIRFVCEYSETVLDTASQ